MSAAEINNTIQTIHDRLEHTSISLFGEDVQQSDLTHETLVVHRLAEYFTFVGRKLAEGQMFARNTAAKATNTSEGIEEVLDGSTTQGATDARTGINNMAAGAEAVGTHMSGMAEKLQSALGHLAAFEADMKDYAALQKAAATSFESCKDGHSLALQGLGTFLENPL